ncbi:MAG: tRNA(His) guanylyltransferase Thg1 family protein [Candidatus Bathyarchaeia archaeon]
MAEGFKGWSKSEIFSKTTVPLETPFFLRLDGWKFRALADAIGAEKPFDERFAQCLVNSGKALFGKGFSPTLVYVVSDELNILFDSEVPFNGRIEKIDSVIPSLVSAAFSIQLQEFFGERVVAAFDSRIIVAPNDEKISEYLVWRQTNAWRNHNNAYAYWLLRKMGYKPSETAKKLKGMKTEELHELLFKHGINLAKTPQWQRRGILIHKKPYQKRTAKQGVTRWEITENWNLPLFSSEEGTKLIRQILEWMRQKRRNPIATRRKNTKN